MKIAELFTRKKHNEGIRVDVKNEAGKVIGWLRVLGLDSDAYRVAHDSYNRELARLAAAVRAKAAASAKGVTATSDGSDAELVAATQAEKDAAKLAERVALVADWSFEDECNEANVTTLLREAPYLSDQVFYVACDRDRFLANSSPDSTDGQAINSGLASQQQQEQTTA